MTYYMGIDPGMSGAIAVIHDDADPITWPMAKYTESDIADIIETYGSISICMMESVHSMPKQGVSSSFKFGQCYGMLRGMLAAHKVNRSFVTPQTWQKALGCLSHGDKNVTKARAQELFPGVKITHANADALLLAYYCKCQKDPLWNLRKPTMV